MGQKTDFMHLAIVAAMLWCSCNLYPLSLPKLKKQLAKGKKDVYFLCDFCALSAAMASTRAPCPAPVPATRISVPQLWLHLPSREVPLFFAFLEVYPVVGEEWLITCR